MADKHINFNTGASFAGVVESAFAIVEPGDGFEYLVGRVKGGKLKVVFEPDSDDCTVNYIDGVDGVGLCLAYEE